MDGLHVFLNGDRGVSVARALAENGHGISSLYAPPSKIKMQSLAAVCRDYDLQLEAVENINAPDFIEKIKASEAKLSIIAGFSRIFHRPMIDTPVYGTVNLHAGRLPQYRGGSPLNWQMINDEDEAGLCIIQVDEGIDTGNVLAETMVSIRPEDTIAGLHEKANKLFPDLVLQVVEGIEKGTLTPRIQNEAEAAYWHQRSQEDGRLHWGQLGAREAYNMIRGLTHPYPGAFCYLGQKVVRLYGAEIPESEIRGTPGHVLYLQGSGPYVICRDRAIMLTDFEVDSQPTQSLPNGCHLI